MPQPIATERRPMNRADIFQKVKEIVADAIDVDASTITEATSFDDLGADSLDRLELVTSFEDEFDATMDDAVLEKIQTIGDAVDAIENVQ
jgi:acyl carrier protein